MAPQSEGSWWDSGEQLIQLIDKGVDISIDLLSCDDGRNVLLGATGLNCNSDDVGIVKRDYAKLHEEFLDSLLQEQSQSTVPVLVESSSSSCATLNTATSMEGDLQSKKIFPLKLSRKSPTITRKSPIRARRPIVDISTMKQVPECPLDTSSQSASQSPLVVKQLPPPRDYLHASCKLQKDKGKGEPPGSDICANGLEPCLDKVRQKMELLTQVALDSKRKSTNMKRRAAKITEESKTFTETRSVIELRMGFLSMQYGILLRWDVMTGKVMLVLLRKMCHESFYKDMVVVSSRALSSDDTSHSSYHVYNVVGGNEAIVQRDDATEVTLLEAPYLVDRPSDFTPSIVTVSILKLAGLSPKYEYAVVVSYQGNSQKCRMEHGSDDILPKDTNGPMEWHVSPGEVELELEVTIEQRRHRHRRKRVFQSFMVPVTFLDKGRLHSVKVTDCVTLTLVIAPQSEFVSWVHTELNARRKEEQVDEAPSPRMVSVDAEEYAPLWDLTCFMWL